MSLITSSTSSIPRSAILTTRRWSLSSAQSGLALTGDAFSVFGLRIGFIILFAGSTWLMARLTARFYGPRAGVLAALALSASGYFGMAVATIAQPDGPLLFFWLLTLDRLAVALDDPDRLAPWLGVGVAWGGAMLSKYHAVLLPAGALFTSSSGPRPVAVCENRGLTSRRRSD